MKEEVRLVTVIAREQLRTRNKSRYSLHFLLDLPVSILGLFSF